MSGSSTPTGPRSRAPALVLALAAACGGRPVEPTPPATEPPAPRRVESAPPVVVVDRWLDLDVYADRTRGFGCAVERGGALWCWGDDLLLKAHEREDLRRGLPRSRPSSPPSQVVGVTDARAVALSTNEICRVDGDGRVRCRSVTRGWAEIAGITDAVDVQLVGSRGCALTAGRELRCWRAGGRGLAVLEDVTDFSLDVRLECAVHGEGAVSCWRYVWRDQDSTTPVTLDEDAGARAIEVEDRDVWILDRDRRIRRRQVLDLAKLDPDDSWVDVDRVPGAIDLAVGREHLCVRDDDEFARCRGRNRHGELGDGTTAGRDHFAPIADLRARGLALAEHQTCVRTPETIACAGLDVGLAQAALTAPTLAQHTIPGLRARALAAHRATTCAIDESGALWCWGSERWRRGESSSTREFGAHAASTPVRVVDGVNALHGLVADDATITWLGDDGVARRARWSTGPAPGLEPSGWVTDPARPFVALAGDRRLYWIERHGPSTRLLYGHDVDDPSPVVGVREPIAVTGPDPVCALERGGRVVCTPMATGDEDALVAGAVPRAGPARAVALTDAKDCALGVDGRVRCWLGRTAEKGPEGRVRKIFSASAARDVGLTEVAALAGDRDTLCTLDRAGALRCWVPLEDGGVFDRPTPTIAGELVEIVAGRGHFCARDRQGAVTCWGDESAGQLGRIPPNIHLLPDPLVFPEPTATPSPAAPAAGPPTPANASPPASTTASPPATPP